MLILFTNNPTIIQQLKNHSDLNKVKFTGTIHCEASLMALAHLFSAERLLKRIPPFSQEKTQELELIFSVSM
jgi:hypothetical protein